MLALFKHYANSNPEKLSNVFKTKQPTCNRSEHALECHMYVLQEYWPWPDKFCGLLVYGDWIFKLPVI